ncbi:MAG: sugar phosphate isomerase/epimerase family protein [Clostridia bacterium]
MFQLGVILDSFRLPLEQALAAAEKLGVQGIQVYATKEACSPQSMTSAQRAEYLKRVEAHGLQISALCGDFGKGFGDSTQNPALIEASKRIMDLAMDLHTNIVTTHIGVVPADSAHPRYRIMQDACGELAAYADRVGAHFAIETGPETAQTLVGFLDGLHSKGVAVNFDPANLVMVTGDDPVQAVYTLKDYIVHTHAKDGRRLMVKNPEAIYGIVQDDLITDEAFIELPLGQGDVDFAGWLHALKEIGYQGYLTIEREVGNNPVQDIALAVDYLKNAGI